MWLHSFGTNQLVGLNERLGALDRCQGGFFTNQQDASPTDTKFNIPVGRCNHARRSGPQEREVRTEGHWFDGMIGAESV